MSARISSHGRRGVAASYSRHRCHPRNSSTSSSNMLASKPWNMNVCMCGCHLSTNAPSASNPHHISFMFFASTTMKFRFHIPMKLRMSNVIAFTRFTSQEKACTWPWLGNAGISCMKAGFCVPELRSEFRGSHLWIVRSMRRPFLLSFTDSLLSGSQQEQGGTEVDVQIGGRQFQRYRNNPQKTTGLFSFGRPKEEKLKSHHHPQLNSVNQRVNVVNRRPLHRQREPSGFRERLRDPVTEWKRTVHTRGSGHCLASVSLLFKGFDVHHVHLLPNRLFISRLTLLTDLNCIFLVGRILAPHAEVPPLLDNRAGESSARPGGFAVEISWRFGLLELGSTSFHREDVAWSGGNLVRASIFAFFAKGSRQGSHQLSRSLWASRPGRDTLNRRVLKAVNRAAATTAELERQLDLSSVAARLRGSPVWFVRVREIRRFHVHRPVEGLYHQQCNSTLLLYTSGYALAQLLGGLFNFSFNFSFRVQDVDECNPQEVEELHDREKASKVSRYGEVAIPCMVLND
ncbi:hypothetical protein Taro_049946 [Colocasia esculenta]|uniref:Uncharacterized protein n=1 Tax=Colocasia esculenta TaxID=4460 RepID=A0A843XCI8_COLES|nr:hypothetical protein [Colocasia esculenta]